MQEIENSPYEATRENAEQGNSIKDSSSMEGQLVIAPVVLKVFFSCSTSPPGGAGMQKGDSWTTSNSAPLKKQRDSGCLGGSLS